MYDFRCFVLTFLGTLDRISFRGSGTGYLPRLLNLRPSTSDHRPATHRLTLTLTECMRQWYVQYVMRLRWWYLYWTLDAQHGEQKYTRTYPYHSYTITAAPVQLLLLLIFCSYNTTRRTLLSCLLSFPLVYLHLRAIDTCCMYRYSTRRPYLLVDQIYTRYLGVMQCQIWF